MDARYGTTHMEERRRIMVLRERAVTFLFWADGLLLVATIAIILLQGFHLWGFNLEAEFLRWLSAAAVGEFAGLLLLLYRFLFSTRRLR